MGDKRRWPILANRAWGRHHVDKTLMMSGRKAMSLALTYDMAKPMPLTGLDTAGPISRMPVGPGRELQGCRVLGKDSEANLSAKTPAAEAGYPDGLRRDANRSIKLPYIDMGSDIGVERSASRSAQAEESASGMKSRGQGFVGSPRHEYGWRSMKCWSSLPRASINWAASAIQW